jgi:hypothetical protein
MLRRERENVSFTPTDEKLVYTVVGKSPENVIDRVRVWLEDRPWTTSTFIPPLSRDPAVTGFIHRRDMYWSRSGCAINLALGVITLGAWLVAALGYYVVTAAIERPKLLVRAFYGGENVVLIQVEAARISHKREPEFLAEIDGWLRSELNAEKYELSDDAENSTRQRPTVDTHDAQNYGAPGLPPRAEPVAPFPALSAATEPDSSSVPNQEIFTQIERLADLRDAGHITDEEFQQKKRDLLDRI